MHPWIKTFHPILGLRSGGRILRNFQTLAEDASHLLCGRFTSFFLFPCWVAGERRRRSPKQVEVREMCFMSIERGGGYPIGGGGPGRTEAGRVSAVRAGWGEVHA